MPPPMALNGRLTTNTPAPMTVAAISSGRAISRTPTIEKAFGASTVYIGSPLAFCGTDSAYAGIASRPVVRAKTTAVERNSFMVWSFSCAKRGNFSCGGHYSSGWGPLGVNAVNARAVAMRSALAAVAINAGTLTKADLAQGGTAIFAELTVASIDEQFLLEVAGLAVATDEIAQRGAAALDGHGQYPPDFLTQLEVAR